MSRIRKLFASGNTSTGFCSFYHEIPPRNPRRVFVLKGGPGTGKSTFMRKILEQIVSRGYDAEQFNCSSDVASLDAISIPALGVAFMDGTAPHVVELQLPGARDELLNLGQFWDQRALKAKAQKIAEVTKENGDCFPRIYRYLAALSLVVDTEEEIQKEAMRKRELYLVAKTLEEELFEGGSRSFGFGEKRELFASALTPQGVVHEEGNLLPFLSKGYLLQSGLGYSSVPILQRLVSQAEERGLFCEVFYCPIKPDKPLHLIIPSRGIGVFSSSPFYSCAIPGLIPLDLSEFLDAKILKKHQEKLAETTRLYQDLLGCALNELQRAKVLHDELESYYSPHMDFGAMNILREEILQRVYNEI